MTKKIIFLLLVCLVSFANAQEFYRSKENSFYWKNRKPYDGYWQQDVYYKIKASVDEKTDIIDASQELTYWNNSPDELTFVYFHLYQNAFQPESYFDNLQKNNKITPQYGKYEGAKQGTVIENMLINGKELKTELDNTILKVYLEKPLKSGEAVTFSIKFKTCFDKGSSRRRMKTFNAYGYKHFDGVHWYPRISVYDRKFGWDTDQHLGKEFYGDFGTYDVELTIANNFVLDATGLLLNRQEVLPDSLRKKLDIKNFANKPWEEKPSEIIKPDGSFKTWKFYADNVHDFAFTADPTYRIGEVEWKGIKCISLAQEPHAAKWQNAAEYTAKVIQVYSEDIGMYAYPKMIVADARDGMEYPMLTLDGNFDPAYRSLFAHEIGHNWFYGMVGSNETYRAALDEGFTQFLTVWCMNKLEGEYEPTEKDSSLFSWYTNKYKKKLPLRDRRAYLAYMSDAVRDADVPINTHSDHFDGIAQGAGYRLVYYKTATMLFNLQYVLGDSLFLKAMQNYFNQWKIAHPYMEDFRNSVIQYTKVDLNWFFDEWFETTKKIDYGIKKIKAGTKENEYKITFKRKGMQMPLDFTVISKGDTGKKYSYHIPNNWFIKKTNSIILPKWHGWDKINPTYTATLIIPEGLENVVIDTTNRLADAYMLNNALKNPYSISFDSKLTSSPDWTKYEYKVRPDLWYNNYDGVKFGLHLNGNYMNYKHVFNSTLWFNSGFAQEKTIPQSFINKYDEFSYTFNYRTGIEKLSSNSYINISSRFLDGLRLQQLGYEKSDRTLKNKFYIHFKSLYRRNTSDLIYLLYPTEWLPAKYNNTINTGLEHSYFYEKGKGLVNIDVRSSTVGSEFDYSSLSMKAINTHEIGKLLFRSRTYVQYSTGTRYAPESQLYLAGANPEDLMENKFTRSRGIIDNTWLGYGTATNHLQMGGGLNLRGYAGYLVAHQQKNGTIIFAYKGHTGASVNFELEFDKLVKFKPKIFREWLKLDTYIFADAGILNANRDQRLKFMDIRSDAGLGAAFTIKKWGPLETAKPLTIRADFPLWLNRPPYAEKDFFQMRWIVGISRAF